MLHRLFFAIGTLAALTAFALIGRSGAQPREPLTRQRIADRFPDAPFATLIDAPPVALKGGGSLAVNAMVCGGCHQAHYADWQQSTHAQALADPQFIAELSKPSSPRWLCLNCHIPLQQQREYRVQPDSIVRANRWDVRDLQRVANPDHDPALTQEAITCATCHVRRDADGQGTIIGKSDGAAAPHRVRKDPAALTNICARCHDPGPVQLTGTFLCWFETRREIAKGSRTGAQCADCHMPEVTRPVVVGGPPKTVRAHHWRGGGPGKTYGAPLGPVAIEVRVEPTQAALKITLTNAHAAHRAPTADPERHYRIIVEQGGKTRVHRIGQRWDWGDAAAGRIARKISDERLYAGESRAFAVPRQGAAATVRVVHVRLSPENLSHMQKANPNEELRTLAPKAAGQLPMLQRHYPLFRTVYRATVSGEVVTVDPDPGKHDAAAAKLSISALRDLLGEGAE
ncbi:MAG: hypothetical protein ACI9U2_001133 [Bradymonadia bacterium]|jgi:hypothetical protein